MLPGEHILPLFIENVGIELLQFVLAGSIRIRVTLVLKMNDCRRGLIQNTQPMRTNFHRQIAVLAIGCFITLVESIHLAPQATTDKNGCTTDVVGFANEAAMPAVIIRIAVPIVERGSIVPDDSTGFLNFSAGINEFRADKPGFLVGFHKLIQRREPVGEDDSVVVQQQDMPSPRMLGGVVAVAEKAHILSRSDDDDTREYGIALGRVVFGTVIGKNNFIACLLYTSSGV